jgi:hypothetical protein
LAYDDAKIAIIDNQTKKLDRKITFAICILSKKRDAGIPASPQFVC